MGLKIRIIVVLIMIGFLFHPGEIFAQESVFIELPAAQTQGGMPLMQALNERKTQRAFSSRELTLEILSNLLWAANGINRSQTGYRTAPSAKNMQEINIYVAKSDGLFFYNAGDHSLELVLAKDIRAFTGQQDFVKDAPVNLIFVADFLKMGDMAPADADFYAATDTGFVSENVYLYCASAGLATVVRGWLDKEALARAMNLQAHQKIILAQTVGYPK